MDSLDLQPPYVVGETDIVYQGTIVLGADITLGVEFYLTKRLNLTTQLTLPVCLYNGTDELLAVAKLSKPFLKTPSREATVKVRLDF